MECAARPCRPAFPSRARGSRCAGPAAAGSSRRSRRRWRRPPQARSAARRRSRSSRAGDRNPGSSSRARAGSSCRRSSMVPSNQVGVSNPTLPGDFDDHRYAARSLRRCRGRARERLRYHPPTPLGGRDPFRQVDQMGLQRARDIFLMLRWRRHPARVTRPGAHVREAQLLQQRRHMALVILDAEALLDDPLEIDAAPPHHAINGSIRARFDNLGQLCQLLGRNP